MPVDFRCASARGRGCVRKLVADANRLVHTAGLDDCELSLSLVSDRAIRALNRRYRGKDSPTDVLSFSQLEEAGAPPPNPRAIRNRSGITLGDVVISFDTAFRQARELRVAPTSRLRTLLVHGFLHLLGYDHERSPSDARRMFARERALAARLDQPSATGVRRRATR